MKLPIPFWLTILIILSSGNVYSFDLFDPNRGKAPPAPTKTPAVNPFAQKAKKAPPPPKKAARMSPQKDFILRGTSRIGDIRAAVLQAPNGKQFVQRLNNSGRTPIEGYPDYYLLQISAREIRVQYPEDSPCRNSNAQNGVQCSADQKTATLNLVHRKAIAAPRKSTRARTAKKAQTQRKLTPEEARKKREEARQKRKELYKNFKRQVIKDEDVPPGMRVVRTPFGDRLVPDNKK